MTELIGITGYAGSGKDSVADVLAQHGYTRSGLADPMRQILAALDPIIDYEELEDLEGFPYMAPLRWNQAIEQIGYRRMKDEYPEARRLPQKLGTEGGRDLFGTDYWVNLWRARNRVTYKSPRPHFVKGESNGKTVTFENVTPNGWALPHPIVITDVRFLNEAAAVKEMGGQVWRVVRPGVGPANDHPSELEQERIEADVTILNDGTLEDLERAVVEAMSDNLVGNRYYSSLAT